jgi:hypothetical protein
MFVFGQLAQVLGQGDHPPITLPEIGIEVAVERSQYLKHSLLFLTDNQDLFAELFEPL